MERRGARRRHAGGVHPAHRPGRPPRHRRRGARRRRLGARAWTPSVVAGLASTRTFPLRSSLPAQLQHGGQPGQLLRPGAGPRAARLLLRPVPGRPVRRRAGPRRRAARAGGRAVRRRDALRPRRRRRVRPAAPGDRRPGEGAVPRLAGQAAHGGRRRAGRAAARRRHPGAVGTAAGPGRRPRPGHHRPRRPAAAGAHRGQVGRPAGLDRLPDAGDARWPGSGCPRTSTTAARTPAATSPRRCATPASRTTSAPGGSSTARRPPTTRCWPTCGARCARHPVHDAARPRGAGAGRRAVAALGPGGRRAAAQDGRADRLADPAVRRAPATSSRSSATWCPRSAPLVPADTEVHRRGGRRPGGHRRRTAARRGSGRRPTCWSPSACGPARGGG